MMLSRLLARMRSLFRREAVDRELEEELSQHIAERAADLEHSGLTRAQAQRRARLEFGSYQKFKEECREVVRWRFFERLAQDTRFGLRMMMRSPGFTSVAVLTLALGIGANTAIFSVVNSALLRPLPYEEPSRLVWVDEFLPAFNDTAVPDMEYTAWKSENRTFKFLAAYDGGGQANLTGAGEPERIETAGVTGSFFDMLGIRPEYGRVFLPEEASPGGPLAVILTNGLWRRKFHSDGSIVGKSIALDGRSYSVVGILGSDFRFPDKAEEPDCLLALQLAAKPDWSAARPILITRVIGRLNSGVSYEQARADLITVADHSTAAMPADFAPVRKGLQVHVIPLHDKLVGDVRPALLILFAAVGFVLLIACANIASLQLVRTAARRREFAVRAAIGAARRRLLQQIFTEDALLAVLGGGAGLAIAVTSVRLLRNSAPAAIRQIGPIAIDYRVFLFALGITALTTILFAALAAMGAAWPDLNSSLKEAAAQAVGSMGQSHLRSVLVVTELTFACVLLIGSGLLIRSFYRLSHVEAGFEPSGVLTVSTVLPQTKYNTDEQRRSFYSQAVDRMRALPGVRAAGLATSIPLTGYWAVGTFPMEGHEQPRAGMVPMTPIDEVGGDYFRVMGIPLLEGRLFNAADFNSGARVAIVSQTFARRFFLNESALGKRLRHGRRTPGHWISIVGVVGDVRQAGLDREIDPHVYFPYSGENTFGVFLALRTNSDPRGLAAAVREQVMGLDASQPIFNVATMEQRLSDSLDSPRFQTTLLAIFAGLALVLATLGIYGVISYFVSQRTHEIGIRVALGATPGDVMRLVVRQGIVLIATGITLGLAGSLALSRYLASLLYGVHPRDLGTLMTVTALLASVALAACYIPARRAMRVDPMVALRYE